MHKYANWDAPIVYATVSGVCSMLVADPKRKQQTVLIYNILALLVACFWDQLLAYYIHDAFWCLYVKICIPIPKIILLLYTGKKIA